MLRAFKKTSLTNSLIMTRSQLVQVLVDKLKLQHPKLTFIDIESSVDLIFEGLSSALTRQNRIEIRGFGSFEVKRRPSRTGRNPKTGDAVMIPAKDMAHFKAGKELRERVNL